MNNIVFATTDMASEILTFLKACYILEISSNKV